MHSNNGALATWHRWHILAARLIGTRPAMTLHTCHSDVPSHLIPLNWTPFDRLWVRIVYANSNRSVDRLDDMTVPVHPRPAFS